MPSLTECTPRGPLAQKLRRKNYHHDERSVERPIVHLEEGHQKYSASNGLAKLPTCEGKFEPALSEVGNEAHT